jgi:transcription termination factor Rho
MDEVIFEEFKGTGNMELHLDHKLAKSFTVDMNKSVPGRKSSSSTRQLSPDMDLRRYLSMM